MDLQQLHDEYYADATAFTSAAISQGFTLTDVGQHSERFCWLTKPDQEIVIEMLRNNLDPQDT
jgi:hypothetical protein